MHPEEYESYIEDWKTQKQHKHKTEASRRDGTCNPDIDQQRVLVAMYGRMQDSARLLSRHFFSLSDVRK